ncbi:MAG: Gfo/Idh/MocA family oxidoreductase, partial [Candidatus Sumerlaeia bacterium]|nr:Gfo/Idh/MocA family oxidoreductase [Candidatus Sumerlaeia bacterium]
MTANEIRFGLIGYGLWGLHHARVIAKTPGAKLAAIAEPSEENRTKAKQAHPDADIVSDYRDLVRRADID